MAMTWLEGGYTRRLSFKTASRGTSIVKPIGCIQIKTTAGYNDYDISGVINTLGIHCTRMAITKSDGTSPLYTEIAYWNTATGEATIYFATNETIAANETKTYYLYFGLDAAENTKYVGVTGSAAAQEVWGSLYSCGGFLAVYHFQQVPILGDASILDSTANLRNLVGGDGLGNSSSVPRSESGGPLGKYVKFDGLNDCLQSTAFGAFISPATVSADLTVEGFFNLTFPPYVANASILRHRYEAAIANYTIMYGFESGVQPPSQPDSSTLYRIKNPSLAGVSTGIECKQSVANILTGGVDPVNTFFSSAYKETTHTTSIVHQDTTDLESFVAYTDNTTNNLNVGSKATAILWIGGCANQTDYQAGFVPASIYELRYSAVTRDKEWMKWTCQSLQDTLNTYLGFEDQGINAGNGTIAITGSGYGGGAGNSNIPLTAQGESGAEGNQTMPFTSPLSFGGWHGDGNATIVPTCSAESYNRGDGVLVVPMPTVEADGYMPNFGLGHCFVSMPTLHAEGAGQTKEGGIKVPMPTLHAHGVQGQVGYANIIVPMPTCYGVGAGQTKEGGAKVPMPTLNARGIMGLVGTGIMAVPMPTCKATGIMSINGIGNCVIPMPTLRATGYMAPGTTETTVLRYSR